MSAVLYPIAALIAIPVALLHGRVLADLWQWFALPLWPLLPAISTLQFAGLLLIKGMIFQRRPRVKGEEFNVSDGLGNLIIYPLIAWGLGWLFHYWTLP
jgi:hypothetical protein